MRGPGARPASISSRRLISAYGWRPPRRSHGGDPAAQIEARRAVGELGGASPRGRVVQVVVQPDHPRDHGVPRHVQHRGAARDRHPVVGPHRRDAVALDHDRAVALDGPPGAVDERDAGQRDDFGVHGHVGGRCGAWDGPLGGGCTGVRGGDGGEGKGREGRGGWSSHVLSLLILSCVCVRVQRIAAGMNHGRKSSKVKQNCTICAVCP